MILVKGKLDKNRSQSLIVLMKGFNKLRSPDWK